MNLSLFSALITINAFSSTFFKPELLRICPPTSISHEFLDSFSKGIYNGVFFFIVSFFEEPSCRSLLGFGRFHSFLYKFLHPELDLKPNWKETFSVTPVSPRPHSPEWKRNEPNPIKTEMMQVLKGFRVRSHQAVNPKISSSDKQGIKEYLLTQRKIILHADHKGLDA